MTGSQKRKGDRAEREAAALIAEHLGIHVRRLLGAGRHDDRGDLDLPGWAVQVADWNNLTSALRQKPLDADEQATHHDYLGVALLRLRGGDWRVAMTPETWARIVKQLPPFPVETSPPFPPITALIYPPPSPPDGEE